MITLAETKQKIEQNPDQWLIHLMDFVDDFRYYRRETALAQPFGLLEIVEGWLKSALQELGVGAKTAAGYGYFEEIT